MDDDTVDDGQILEQESDNKNLWWSRIYDRKCARCGSKDLGYTDYYWTDEGDVECAPRCNVCHFDLEAGRIIPPPPPEEPDPNVSIESIGMGQYLIKVRQEGGEWNNGRPIWSIKA